MNIYLEVFGYIGSALVLISMIMTSMNRLRIINLIGNAITMVYSILVGAYPVVILNLGIIIVNTIHLIRALSLKKRAEQNSEGEKT